MPEGHRPDRWAERLAGRRVRAVDAHGKRLFVRFEGGLTLHSRLRMTGAWGVHRRGQPRRRRHDPPYARSGGQPSHLLVSGLPALNRRSSAPSRFPASVKPRTLPACSTTCRSSIRASKEFSSSSALTA
jgi:Formamidopyrimidine-DNA glycosylase N-terminal domain